MSFITQEKFVAFFKMRKKQVLFWSILALAFISALHPFCGSAGWDQPG